MHTVLASRTLADGFFWLFTYTLVWWLLTGGAGWGFGAPWIVAASALSLRLRLGPARIKLLHLPGFLVFFIRRLWAGGWDVARRALHPQCPLNPGWASYSLRSQNVQERILLSAMVGLFPGTLAAQIDGDQLRVHTLDLKGNWHQEIAALEAQLARLLGSPVL